MATGFGGCRPPGVVATSSGGHQVRTRRKPGSKVWQPTGLPSAHGTASRDVCSAQCRAPCLVPSSPRWRFVAAVDSHRVFACAACRVRVVICRRCDRGNKYCAAGCAAERRRAIRRTAERNYRKSELGRRNNAARQRRYRDRRRRGAIAVTHPSPPAAAAPLETVSRRAPRHHEHDRNLRASARTRSDSAATCCFCGELCGNYSRNSFLRRRGMPRTWP